MDGRGTPPSTPSTAGVYPNPRSSRPAHRAPDCRGSHLFAAYGLGKDQLYGRIKKTRNRSEFLEFCRYLRSLHPVDVRIAIVCDNCSPHLTAKRCRRVADRAEANNVEIARTPADFSWLNRIEDQFTALRRFTLDGTGHPGHKAQGGMIRRYIVRRNENVTDKRLAAVVSRTNAA